MGRTAKRDTAKNKGSGVVSKFLLVLITLLADELDGFQVFNFTFSETDGRQHGLEGGERRDSGDGRRWSPAVAESSWAVPKLCQKCM